MSSQEIYELLKDNTLSYNNISMSSLTNIMTFVHVDLKIDAKSLDYYYAINVDELSNSEIPKEEVEVLKSQGWSFSDDRKYLLLFLKNN